MQVDTILDRGECPVQVVIHGCLVPLKEGYVGLKHISTGGLVRYIAGVFRVEERHGGGERG